MTCSLGLEQCQQHRFGTEVFMQRRIDDLFAGTGHAIQTQRLELPKQLRPRHVSPRKGWSDDQPGKSATNWLQLY
jgi:hypothetical protein